MAAKRISWILVLLVLCSIIYAAIGVVTTFTNGLSKENYTFSTDVNITRFINIPLYSYISNMTLNMTGLEQNFTLQYQEIADQNSFNVSVYFYSNYTKNRDANYAIWQVRHGHQDNGEPTYNVTVPEDCFSLDTLQLRFKSDVGGLKFSWGECYNGSDWYQITHTASNQGEGSGGTPYPYPLSLNDTNYGTGASWSGTNWINGAGSDAWRHAAVIFEEGIFWINTHPINISIYNPLGNSFLYRHEGVLNITTEASLNITMLNNVLSNGCNCTNCSISGGNCAVPLTFSATPGILEVQLLHANYTYGLDSCTNSFNIPSNATALNITFYDPSDALTDVTYEAVLDYDYTTTYNYNFSTSDIANNITMCIYPNWATFYTDALIDYDNNSYNTYQMQLSNATQNILLYTQTETTPVTFYVKDVGTQAVENAFIQILKWDVGTNSYKLTEILRTDSLGSAVGNIVLNTEFYRFIIQHEGETKLIDPATQGVKIYTTTRTFRISTEDTDWFNNYDIYTGASTNLTYNNDTTSFTYTWTDPTGTMHQGCLRVVQRNSTATTTLSDTCTTSTASTIVYTITPTAGNRYVATGYFQFDDEYITDIVEWLMETGYELYNIGAPTFTLLMTALLIMTFALIGIPFPELSFILMAVGMIFTAVIGLWEVAIGMVVAVIIVGSLHMYKGSGK